MTKIFSNVGFTYQILRALILIMKNVEMMPWNVINEEFVSKISAYLNGSSKMESNDSLNLSLDIILAIMENQYFLLCVQIF